MCMKLESEVGTDMGRSRVLERGMQVVWGIVTYNKTYMFLQPKRN